jgi:hypothetical protein
VPDTFLRTTLPDGLWSEIAKRFQHSAKTATKKRRKIFHLAAAQLQLFQN